MNSKYSNLLTVLLVLVIIAIIGIISFLGFKMYQSNKLKDTAEDFVDSFISDENKDDNNNNTDDEISNDIFDGIENGSTNNGSSSGKVKKFNGYTIAGTIEIPSTKIKLPIIAQSDYSKTALETSVCEYPGVGLNQVGNSTIAGHNYRNGKFFSNNKKLNIGDKIYITDLTGKRVAYTIYNKYETTENDAEYMYRDTQGAVEVSLTTCTDDSKARLVIWAKADS